MMKVYFDIDEKNNIVYRYEEDDSGKIISVLAEHTPVSPLWRKEMIELEPEAETEAS